MVGQGPGLLVPPGWIGHLELLWQDPLVRAFYLPLARHRTVVRWDRPGCGLSDPSPDPPSLEEDLEVLEAVADQLGLDCFDLLGISMGAPTSIAFATRHPDRVGRLVVYGGFANGQELGPGEARAAMMDLIRAHWGLGSNALADIFIPDADAERRARFTRMQRASGSAEVVCQLLAQGYLLRIEDLLDQVATPSLVIHRREDRAVPYRLGRDLAARIPGARLVSLDGQAHFPYDGDAESIVGATLEFLGATATAPAGRAHRPPAGGGGAGRRGLQQPPDRRAAGDRGALGRGSRGAHPPAAGVHLPDPDRRLVGAHHNVRYQERYQLG
jgi:pimeloyl-ACP methyl ester carboxylesterase